MECCLCGEELKGEHLMVQVVKVEQGNPVDRSTVAAFHGACFEGWEYPVISDVKLAVGIRDLSRR